MHRTQQKTTLMERVENKLSELRFEIADELNLNPQGAKDSKE